MNNSVPTMVFYLKINRENNYSVTNFMHWLKVTMLYEDAITYVICDNPKLQQRIESQYDIENSRVIFIESERNNPRMNKVLEDICCCAKWIRVGQAHLTAHWHAKLNGYSNFWNIDADDTFVCLSPLRIVELLNIVEKYSNENGIDVNGLDMWRSMSAHEKWSKGINWSLGITYINNSLDWLDIFEKYSHGYKKDMCIDENDNDVNLDWYFTYLKDKNAARIETFYFEKMKFMHFYDCFFDYPHLSMLCKWSNGNIHYPLLSECFGSRNYGVIPIADDVIRLDMKITDDESLLAMISNSKERFAFVNDIYDEELEIENVMNEYNKKILKDHNCSKIICWGAGAYFKKNYKLIKKAYDLKFVCDNDSSKWGKEIVDNIYCISPEEIRKEDGVYILIMTDDIFRAFDITKQLVDMDLLHFDFFGNWLKEVEGME